MKQRPRSLRRSLTVALAALTLAAGLAVAAPGDALAREYQSSKAGHPLRIVAYVLHPVGVVLDYLVFRPAHWLISHEPLKTLVGHTD